MKNKITYLLLFVLVVNQIFAQQVQFNLAKGGTCLYNGSLYTYGLSVQKQKTVVCIYRSDLKLKLKDSLIVGLSKPGTDSYLQLSCDTLHNYLNIYLQEKEKKLVTIFRFTKTFEPVATIDNVDIARLNSTSVFNNDFLYYKNNVYAIAIQNDTSGKQFYLNKYTLKSDQTNFEYAFSWQFPFEKKEIRSAHIFLATKNQVFVYVHISAGSKTGQWIVIINSETGKLVRGTKINSKGESDSYLFGNCILDSTSKALQIVGEKFTPTQFKETENKLAITNRAFASVYLAELDSTGELTSKQEFKIPIVAPASGAKKTNSNYFLRIATISKKNGAVSFETDIYGNTTNALCYFYLNTTVFRLIPNADKLMLEKNTISTNPLLEKFYFTNDKLDANGKLCIDSLSQFEKLFYKPVIFPVKQSFKSDETNNPAWMLAKLNLKKNTVNYTLLQPVNKIYQLTLIDELPKAVNPDLIPLSTNAFLIGTQTNETKYQLKLVAW